MTTADEPTPDLTDMNARLLLRRTTSPAGLTERLFGKPEPETDEDSAPTGGDAA